VRNTPLLQSKATLNSDIDYGGSGRVRTFAQLDTDKIGGGIDSASITKGEAQVMAPPRPGQATGWKMEKRMRYYCKNKNPEGSASSQPEAAMLETWQIGMKCCSMRGDDETMACSALEFELT
jgi:hypothetical protein